MQVVDVPDKSHYEARTDDGEVAGIAAYELADGVITFVHTEVSLEGHGVGGALARHALDEARARGLRVVPRCPFIRGWIQRNPDYADLVDTPDPGDTAT